MQPQSEVRTYLFTDIEGSARMWEESPERMRPALERHDAIARGAVEEHRGTLVKRTGDGVHAVFEDPADALAATLELQLALADPAATAGLPLRVRCGLHAGADERREGDFYGTAVNRAARIMSTAHGGQVLVSHTVASLIGARLPAEAKLVELGAVRLRDLASPERLYQLAHPRLREKFPALRSLEATPNNLPHQLTSFIGRAAELAEVKRLVREFRLLTLLGVGGIGKSRLSVQAGADLLDDFPDGVWLVELATLTDPRLVPQAVASALGVKEAAGRPVIEALVRHFKDRRLLLVLDNCEHLLQACAELARQLLQAGPGAKVLASSREPLRVTGEATYPVPALPESEAERLFVDRALAARPGFRVNGYAEAVAAVCRRLDGIPLAIELAAARVRTLSPEAIAARLDDRFRLLTRGDQTALPRQQTLRALIDWSHELLTEAERAVFRRLAVFAGGWTLEAAEAVTAFGTVATADVLDLVTQLAEKSLVVVEPHAERYRFLETVRQYAYERLREAHELDPARERHLGYYVAFAERARPQLIGPKQGEWLALLDAERENILTAHNWCNHAPDGGALGLKLVNCTKLYWFNRALLTLGERITVEALKRQQAEVRDLARCQALFTTGQLQFYMGRYRDAPKYLEESLDLAREIGDQRRIAAALQLLGLASLGIPELSIARRFLEQGLASVQRLGNEREIAAANNAMGQLSRLEGRMSEAEQHYEQVLKIAGRLGDREVIAIGLLNLAMVAVERNAAGAARERLRNAFTITEETGSRSTGQSLLEVCAGLAIVTNELELGARLFGTAESQAATSGMHRDPADSAFLDPLVNRARLALGLAAFSAAEQQGRRTSYEEGLARAREWLAGLETS